MVTHKSDTLTATLTRAAKGLIFTNNKKVAKDTQQGEEDKDDNHSWDKDGMLGLAVVGEANKAAEARQLSTLMKRTHTLNLKSHRSKGKYIMITVLAKKPMRPTSWT